MFTYIKYTLFRWHFKSIFGAPMNDFQKDLFLEFEQGGQVLSRLASRSSGATVFLVIYADFCRVLGRSVEVYGSDYLVNVAHHLLKEYDFEILSKEEYKKPRSTLVKDIYLVDLEGDHKDVSKYFKFISENSKLLLVDTK